MPKAKRKAVERRKGKKPLILLLRTSAPGVASWPEGKPFVLPDCQVMAPVGLLYLASVLRRSMGNSVRIVVESLSAAVKSEEEIRSRLEDVRPDILGLSTMTVEGERAAHVAAAAREACDPAAVILGGPYPTFQPEESLERTGADAAVLGEGESAIVPLVRALLEGRSLGSVPSLAFREGGRIVTTPRAPAVKPLDSIPLPAWDMVPIETYSRMYNMNGLPVLRPPYAPILTSRGCPYRCSFCHNMFGKVFRPRSPENVLEEMRLLHDRHGVREFHIIDDIFNLDAARMEAICRGILDSGLKIAFNFPNGIRGDILTFEQIRLLRDAGCYCMCLSLESAAPRILKLMRKAIDIEKLERNARYASSIGIITKCIFMVGYPSETREEMETTLRWVRDSGFDLPQHSVACPLPGAEMSRHAVMFKKDFRLPDRAMNYNALKNLSAMDEEEFRLLLANGVSEILSVPRRAERLRQIRRMWGPEAEPYFDWTLAEGEGGAFPIRGGRDATVPRRELLALVAGLTSTGALEPGWSAHLAEAGTICFVPPGGGDIRILVNDRNDEQARIGHTRKYNLIFKVSKENDVVSRETIEKIVASLRAIDPLEDAAPSGAAKPAPGALRVDAHRKEPPAVLLIFPPWACHFQGPESGLAYISAYLRSRGVATQVLDLNVRFLDRFPEARERGPTNAGADVLGERPDGRLGPPSFRIPDIRAWLSGPQPLYERFFEEHLGSPMQPAALLGLSICAPAQIPPALMLARRVKEESPSARIVIGGMWCAAARHLLPRLLDAFPFIDAAVPFEGERVLELLARLPGGSPLEDLPGILTRSSVSMRPPLPGTALASLPAPDFDGWPMNLYGYLSLPLRTIRGCPWGKCVFCCSLSPDDRRRGASLPPSLAADHIRRIVGQTGVRDVTLANHLTPPGDLHGIARALIAKSLEVPWTSMARFDRKFTQPILRDLAASRCRSLQFGLESIDPADQRRLRKNIDAGTVLSNLRDCQEAGVKTEVTVMTFPGQAPGGFERTLAFLLENRDIVHGATVLRFSLPYTSPAFRNPRLLGLDVRRDDEDLDVYNIPYVADGELPLDEFLRLSREFRKEWNGRRGPSQGAPSRAPSLHRRPREP